MGKRSSKGLIRSIAAQIRIQSKQALHKQQINRLRPYHRAETQRTKTQT